MQHQNRHSRATVGCCKRSRNCTGSGGGTFSLRPGLYLAFPRRAASAVHVCHHVVQHVGQRVLDHGSPAHVTHLMGQRKEQKTINLHPQRGELCIGDLQWMEEEKQQDALTGWYLRSFGGCLKWGPKLTETWKKKKVCVKTYTCFFCFVFLRGRKGKSQATHCAALVQGDSWEVESFEQILISNTLAHSIFKENHLCLEETESVRINSHLTETSVHKALPHPAGAHQLETFLRFVHVILFLKVQVAFELDQRLQTEQRVDIE